MADSYYHKGKLQELHEKKEFGNYLQYQKNSQSVYINNTLIVKFKKDVDSTSLVQDYPLSVIQSYGRVVIYSTPDIHNVLPLCKKIYENESVEYVQPSFVKKIASHNIRFEELGGSEKRMNRRILSHSNENTKTMLDDENSINFYKYYDDVFRYEDESYWHLYNKGGFISQAFYQGEYYDVLSREDIDTNVLEVIDSGITGKNIRIAVVDSSFEISHPDLRFSYTYNFFRNNRDVTPDSTSDFHGTSVAGVIGANAGNNYGIMGVAPDAYMIAFNGLFEIEEDSLFTQNYVGIFYKALELDIDIINCSWTTVGLIDEASEDAINTFVAEGRDGKGGFVVFSSGNEGSTSLSSEAALLSVISVGSVEVNGARSLYSNFGPKLDLVAPSNFVSLDLKGEDGFEDNEMGFVAGTSFSAPIVSGVLALILEANPTLTHDEVLNILYSTTKKVGEGAYDFGDFTYEYDYSLDEEDRFNILYPKSKQSGYGLIDAERAVKQALVLNKDDENLSALESENFLEDIHTGWNFVGTQRVITDLSVFNEVEIVWCYIDAQWKGYSANDSYLKELREQDKIFLSVPRNSGLWVYKNEE